MRKTIYRFGRFELDPKGRELSADGGVPAMPPKSLDCLIYLIAHRDRAVGRDELISAVWGRADVSDHLLAQTLLGARRVLGDVGAGERNTIATVSRFGYRWLPPTEVLELDLPTSATDPDAVAGAASSEPVASLPEAAGDIVLPVVDEAGLRGAAAGPAPSLRLRIVAALVVAAMVVAAIVFLGGRRPEGDDVAAPAATRPVEGAATYLVLPVTVTAPGREDAWIRLGAMEYLAERLRDDASLRVLSSNQAMAMVGEEQPGLLGNVGEVQRIRSITGATHVIEPRAMRSANAWMVELDVYHEGSLSTFTGLDARPLEAAAAAVRRYMDSIGIAASERAEVAPEFEELLQRVDAAFLKGDLRQARSLIEAAPQERRGQPELAIRDARVAFRAGQLDIAQAMFQSLTSARPGLPDAVRARAYIGLGGVAGRRGDFQTGVQHFSQAIALLEKSGTPITLGTAHMERGMVRASMGEYEAAMADFGRARIEMERAGDRLALGILDFNVGLAETFRSRWETALASIDRAIDVAVRYGVDDVVASALLGKSDVQLTLAENAGALETTERFLPMLAHLDNPILVRHLVAVRLRALMANARLDDAQRELEEFLARSEPARADPQFELLQADIHRRRGDFAAAMARADDVLDRIRRRADPTSGVSLCPAALSFFDAASHGAPWPTAQRWLDALAEPSQGEDPAWLKRYCVELAQAESSADLAVATPHYAAAIALADENGHRELFARSGVAYIRRLLQGGHDLDRAVTMAGRLSALAGKDYRVALATAAVYRASGDQRLADAALAKAIALADEGVSRLPY